MYRLTTFSVGPYDNNVYVLSDPKSKEALLIDAANDAPRIIKELDGLRVSHILTTHGHGDHVHLNGINRWLGGVHLCEGAPVWRWDAHRSRLALS